MTHADLIYKIRLEIWGPSQKKPWRPKSIKISKLFQSTRFRFVSALILLHPQPPGSIVTGCACLLISQYRPTFVALARSRSGQVTSYLGHVNAVARLDCASNQPLPQCYFSVCTAMTGELTEDAPSECFFLVVPSYRQRK